MPDVLPSPENALWRGLQSDAAANFAGRLQGVEFAPGDVIMRQGETPDFAIFILDGEAEVVRRLPGGREFVLDRIGAGAVVGEVGLLADVKRLATARATERTQALRLSAPMFRAAVDMGDQAAFAVARNVLAAMAARLRGQTERLLTAGPARVLTVNADDQTGAGLSAASFDWPAFARILPGLRRLSPEAAAAAAQAAECRIYGKGERIAPAGAPLDRVGFVLRGAVEAVGAGADRGQALDIVGPGGLCGAMAAIDGAPSPVAYIAREDSAVMSFAAPAFQQMLEQPDSLGIGMVKASADSLANALRRANNNVASCRRLARIARVRATA